MTLILCVDIVACDLLIAGEVVYGIVEYPIPKVVSFGAAISIATQLMLCSRG